MENDKGILMKSAMFYGLLMGMFWVFKYLFFAIGVKLSFFISVYWGLSILVPIIAYVFTKHYREDIGGQISFFHAWIFGILLYMFAALIVSLAHYVFYRYFAPPDMLNQTMNEMVALLKNANAKPEVISQLEKIDISPISMAIQGIFSNLFYGIILSIPVAAILCRNNSTGTIGNNNTRN